MVEEEEEEEEEEEVVEEINDVRKRGATKEFEQRKEKKKNRKLVQFSLSWKREKKRRKLTTGWSASILFSISLDEDEQTAVTMVTTTSHLDQKPVHSSVYFSQSRYSHHILDKQLNYSDPKSI